MSEEFVECATAVTYNPDNGKFLLVQRAEHDSNPGKWEFPGGGIDEGEEPEDSVLRELEEEADLVGQILESGDSTVMTLGGRKFRWHPFLVEVESRRVELSHEHQDYEWIDVEDIQAFDTVDGIKQDLETVGVDL